jgi:LacI family transcriptional regulator
LFLREGTPHLSQLLGGALGHPVDANLQVAVAPCRSVREAYEEARRLVHNGINGFILPFPLCEDAGLVRQIERVGCAIVSLACSGAHAGHSSVGVDEAAAAFAMTRYLIQLGHRRIGFIKGDCTHYPSIQRLAGYRAALEAHHIAFDETLVADSVSTYRSGLDAAEWLIGRAARPTAIFAGDDETAAAAIAVAYRAGIAVPGDLTVTGFGDTPLAESIWPALTSVRVPAGRMVERAIQILVRQIRSNAPAQEEATLDFEVIRRQTDAVPRARPPAPARAWA